VDDTLAPHLDGHVRRAVLPKGGAAYEVQIQAGSGGVGGAVDWLEAGGVPLSRPHPERSPADPASDVSTNARLEII
jgi:hypothetical protein